ncbi:hypothetical protein WR25_11171 [Diploscapter pachys]|uniref:Uncharacterized protein n=1 Tax=Diploscapter pachys TaxID=2018661 RepID=A0A2A2KBE6_9BILA|nr:hypothetical protein WR25_11171 [Diploscapter pachys]
MPPGGTGGICRSGHRRLLEDLVGPLVQALAGYPGGKAGGSVHFWADAQHDLARGRFFGSDALFGAIGQVVVECLTERLVQRRHGAGVEADDVPQAEHAADENIVTRVVLDAGGIPFVSHAAHGRTPARSRNSRASSI